MEAIHSAAMPPCGTSGQSVTDAIRPLHSQSPLQGSAAPDGRRHIPWTSWQIPLLLSTRWYHRWWGWRKTALVLLHVVRIPPRNASAQMPMRCQSAYRNYGIRTRRSRCPEGWDEIRGNALLPVRGQSGFRSFLNAWIYPCPFDLYLTCLRI